MDPEQKAQLKQAGLPVSKATEKDWIKQLRISYGGLIAMIFRTFYLAAWT